MNTFKHQTQGFKALYTVSSVHLGVNLDLTISDGVQTVTAHTILAWGEIYRPHYRYLIK